MSALYIYAFSEDYSYCRIATGTNGFNDGPERTVAIVEFKGDAEQRRADFEALRADIGDCSAVFPEAALAKVQS